MAIFSRIHDKNAKPGKGIKVVPAKDGPFYFKISHVGKVVDKGETYLYDGDSSYWAMVADGKTFKMVVYGSTYDWGPSASHAEIDASPALMSSYRRYKEAKEAAFRKAEEARAEENERLRKERAMATPRKGARIEVVKGTKVPKGLVGVVFWTGPSAYGDRVGFETEKGERLFTAIGNVKVLAQPPGFRP